MRPTKGEIRVTPASAQAMAWAMPNSSVRLQWMPSRSSFSAARTPSQVVASLISTRLRETPAASYSAIRWRALAMLASVSKLRRGSTSVDTRPGTCLRISQPKATNSRSMAPDRSSPAAFACASAPSSSGR